MGRYARRLTRQELIEGGITNITEDGRIWKNGEEITEFSLDSSGYKKIFIYDRDENGCCIKENIDKKSPGHYTYKQRSICLNRAILAWFNGEIATGLVADHIDNNKDNYSLSNLQAITPEENVNKDKENWHTKEIKCKMDRPRIFYEDKLNKYIDEYIKAKETGDAKLIHKLRCNISQTRGRLRYWDSHKEEYYSLAQEKREIELLKYYKKLAKENNDMIQWHQICRLIKHWPEYDEKIKEQILKCLFEHTDRY